MAIPPYAPPAGSGLSRETADLYRNNIPEAGFWSYLMGRGLTGVGPMDRFAQGRYSNYLGQYMAEAAKDPNMGFFDYLQQRQPNPEAEFQGQSPEQRFDFSSRNLTPRARWVFR